MVKLGTSVSFSDGEMVVTLSGVVSTTVELGISCKLEDGKITLVSGTSMGTVEITILVDPIPELRKGTVLVEDLVLSIIETVLVSGEGV